MIVISSSLKERSSADHSGSLLKPKCLVTVFDLSLVLIPTLLALSCELALSNARPYFIFQLKEICLFEGCYYLRHILTRDFPMLKAAKFA
jgi:hypothetical protein